MHYLILFLSQWFLELWDASHAVLGIIAIIAVQRAIQKILIAVFLSREYKHDETNRAWWTGKWYGRGLGNSAMSQPAREFIVKIVEMSLWSGDFLLGHVLLIILTPPVLIPFIDRMHSTMLCKCISTPHRSRLLSHVYIDSLASSVKTNTCPVVLGQTKAATKVDCKHSKHLPFLNLFNETLLPDRQIHVVLYRRGRVPGRSGRFAYVFLVRFQCSFRPDNSSITAAIFRDIITINCTLCQNI